MEKIIIRKIKFTSFIKLGIVSSFSFGTLAGILFFILSLLGGNVAANFGPITLYGIQAGVASIVIAPTVAVFMGTILFTVAYFPCMLVFSLMKGIKLKGIFENITNDEIGDNRKEE